MRTEALIEQLGHELRPVHRRRPGREMMMLLLLALGEVGGLAALGLARPDMPYAMEHWSFWWRLAGLGTVAGVSGTVALLSFDPARSPRLGKGWLLGGFAAIVATGWIIDAHQVGLGDVTARLDWPSGLGCVWKILVLSVPPAVALSLLLRRGAPTDRDGTSVAAGLACAACGAFAFTFACPSDDPLYIAVWYTLACSLVTVTARALFRGISRW